MSPFPELRAVVPVRPLNAGEALRVAEVQAARLLKLWGLDAPPVPEEAFASVPKVRIERMSPLPVSGAAHWSKGTWLILLNGSEPYVRQRFSLAHEFKHVLDNPFIDVLYPSLHGFKHEQWREQVADHFAACLLMPRAWVKRLYGQGVQDHRTLARRFGVSQAAMRVRLLSLGLEEPAARCAA